MKYLEYVKTSGVIVSEITSETVPKTSDKFAYLPVASDTDIDTSLYAVRNGQLVKLYETKEERLQREKVRREHGEEIRKRMKAITNDATIAMLEDDEDTLNKLKAEYKNLKAYL